MNWQNYSTQKLKGFLRKDPFYEEEITEELKRRKERGRQAWFGISFVVISLIFVGVISWQKFVELYKGDGNQVQILLSFILAGFFPLTAIAYILFQKKTTLRRLGRDFWMLGIDLRDDPDKAPLSQTQTMGYVSRKYDEFNPTWNFVIQATLVALMVIFGLVLFFWPPTENELLDINTLRAMNYGFLGAYLFSAQLVYRRYTTFDLQPSVYTYCVITLIAGLVFNFVAFKAIDSLTSSPTSLGESQGPVVTNPSISTDDSGMNNTEDLNGTDSNDDASAIIANTNQQGSETNAEEDSNTEAATGLAGGLMAILAFSLGYFPYLALRWFNRLAHTALQVRQRRSEFLPLGLIDGISEFHETRLRDEGIEDIQNLSAASLDELLINTRFSAQQVIEWVDQAALYVYLTPDEINSFRRAGIRTYTDLKDQWSPYFVLKIQNLDHISNGPPSPENESVPPNILAEIGKKINEIPEDVTSLRREQALRLQVMPEYLDALYQSTQEGPNVAHIETYWSQAKKLQDAFRRVHKDANLDLILGEEKYQDKDSITDDTWDDDWDQDAKFVTSENFLSESDTNKTNILVGKAWNAKEKNQYKLAIRYAEQANQLDPDRGDIYVLLSELYAITEELEKAKDILTKITPETDPENGGDTPLIGKLVDVVDNAIEHGVIEAGSSAIQAWAQYQDTKKDVDQIDMVKKIKFVENEIQAQEKSKTSDDEDGASNETAGAKDKKMEDDPINKDDDLKNGE